LPEGIMAETNAEPVFFGGAPPFAISRAVAER
jgi:hypothetical protein